MRINKYFVISAMTIALSPFASVEAWTVFSQDFEGANPLSSRERIVGDTGSYGTRTVNCGSSCPFSAYDNDNTDNWGVHKNSTNPYAGGGSFSGSDPTGMVNNEMAKAGNHVMGHVFANYDDHEDSFYQISNLTLDAGKTWDKLTFDFDSWIESDIDGFAVSIRTGNGTGAGDITNNGWSLLNPIAGTAMQYSDLGDNDSSLNDLSGFDPSSDDCGTLGSIGPDGVCGYDGHGGGSDMMAGVAMFDLSQFGSQKIDLRFSFASDGNTGGNCYNGGGVTIYNSCASAEGINIDNIVVTADHPGTSIPEPTSLALMLLGATAAYRKRR